MSPADERTALISAARTAATIELGAPSGQCSDAGLRLAERIATRTADLYLPDRGAVLPPVDLELRPLPGSSVFVRQDGWVPPDVAVHFDAVMVASRVESRGKPGRCVFTNTDADWYREVRAAGVDVILWDWMVPPHIWDHRIDELFERASDLGARGVLLNVEPGSGSDKHDPVRDWRGKHAEAKAFAAEARRLADKRELELWFTSWALPPGSFPLEPFCEVADVCIPQPYEVHGRTGPEYVAEVLDRWRAAGAKRIILGRGAHELDDSDDDAWRTVEQIAVHRETTPAGMPEAWWPAAGSLAKRGTLVDAMVTPR